MVETVYTHAKFETNQTCSSVDITLGNKANLKDCHVTTKDIIMTESFGTHIQMIIHECAKFKVDRINKSDRIGY